MPLLLTETLLYLSSARLHYVHLLKKKKRKERKNNTASLLSAKLLPQNNAPGEKINFITVLLTELTRCSSIKSHIRKAIIIIKCNCFAHKSIHQKDGIPFGRDNI